MSVSFSKAENHVCRVPGTLKTKGILSGGDSVGMNGLQIAKDGLEEAC